MGGGVEKGRRYSGAYTVVTVVGSISVEKQVLDSNDRTRSPEN